jgi:hypothetical protein
MRCASPIRHVVRIPARPARRTKLLRDEDCSLHDACRHLDCATLPPRQGCSSGDCRISRHRAGPRRTWPGDARWRARSAVSRCNPASRNRNAVAAASHERDRPGRIGAQAIAYTRQLQAHGVQSIDVGCMQVNLMYHPDAFQSLEEAFDPGSNVRYAAKFLNQLREKARNWETASAWYHSANPEEGAPYRDKIVTLMATEAKGTAPYEAIPVPTVTTSPVAVSVRPGMLSGHANIIMLPGAATGTVLTRSNAVVAGLNGSPTGPMLLTGATSVPGRGLDAYRLQPVRVVKLSIIVSR